MVGLINIAADPLRIRCCMILSC